MPPRRLAIIKITVPSTLIGNPPEASAMEDWVKVPLQEYSDHSYELKGAHANVVTRDNGAKVLTWLVENTMRAGSPIHTQTAQGRLISMMIDKARRAGYGASARFESYSEPLYGSVASWESGSQAATPTRDTGRSLLSRVTENEPSPNQDWKATLWAKVKDNWKVIAAGAVIGGAAWYVIKRRKS